MFSHLGSKIAHDTTTVAGEILGPGHNNDDDYRFELRVHYTLGAGRSGGLKATFPGFLFTLTTISGVFLFICLLGCKPFSAVDDEGCLSHKISVFEVFFAATFLYFLVTYTITCRGLCFQGLVAHLWPDRPGFLLLLWSVTFVSDGIA